MKVEYWLGNHKFVIVLGILVLLTGVFLSGVYFGKTGKGWPFIKKNQIWSIGIYEGNDISNLRPSPNVRNPVLTAKDVNDVAAEFVADPFMVEHDGKWYMFFEVLNRKDNKGDIGLATSTDCLHWEYKQIVLDEPFHLSYPYVFEWQNEFYMIPETHLAHAIRLYKAIDFPLKWALHKEIIKGDYSDPSIVQYEGKWWLFATKGPYWDNMYLFYSDNLDGDWIEHPKSPVIMNNSGIARPGGRILSYDGRLVRLAQDCEGDYGSKLRAFEITELSVGSYKEHQLFDNPILSGTGNCLTSIIGKGWNSAGMHHLDFHIRDGENGIGCVDGWRQRPSFDLRH